MLVARRFVPVLPLLGGVAALLVSVGDAHAQGNEKASGGGGPLAPCAQGTYGVSVTPDGGAVSWPQNTNGHTSTFTVTNTNPNCTQVHYFTHTETGPIYQVSLNKTQATIPPLGSTTVIATYNVGAAGTGVLTLKSTIQYSSVWDTGYLNVTVTDAPDADWSPYNADNQDLSRCAADCFATTYSYTTVPYYTFDAPRSVTLVYHGDRVNPKPFIHVNARYTGSLTVTALRLRLQKSDGTYVTFLNGETTLRFQPSSSWVRLAGQFDAAVNGMASTGVYNVTIVVGAEFGSAVGEVSLATTLIVVNENASPIARGWTLAGVQRLFTQADGSALITEGDGSAVYFKKSGSSFITPAGEFSKLAPSGSNEWLRSYPDSTKVYFRSDGRMRDVYDGLGIHSGRIRYDGSNRVQWIDDPYAIASGYGSLFLSYGTNGLTSIRDNLGSSSDWRYTNVTVQADSTLTTIADPDGITTTLGYDAQRRLGTVTGRRGYLVSTYTTTYGYDVQSGKLSSVTLPAVPIYQRGTMSPVMTLASWQQVSVPYGATSGTPFTGVAIANVKGSVTDAGSHTTSFTVNKWGQPLVNTDPLNRNTTSAYTAGGLASTIQYPTGGTDSMTYNGDGLPTVTTPAGSPRTYAHYAAWGMPDSIWGDGQPRQRMWVAGGKVDSLELGSYGSSTHMHYHYDTYGRVTKVVDALLHVVDSVEYFPIGTKNGNTNRHVLPNNRITSYGYDVYGRDTSWAQTGQATGRVHYDILNRPRETFNGPDTSRTRYEYDLAYNDVYTIPLRVTDAKGQLYWERRNMLGWLVSQTDPTGRDDWRSYDIEGLLRLTTTRRGYNVSQVYDALHRLLQKAGDGTDSSTFTYSTDGRVVTGSTPLTSETRYLNVRGQPDSVKTHYYWWDYWRRYAYTAAGLLDSVYATGSAPAFWSRKYGYDTQRGTLQSIRLNGRQTSFSLSNDLLPAAVHFPAGDSVVRGFTSSHGDMAIWSPAGYGHQIERTMTYASGRLWRQIADSLHQARVFGYDGLGRLVADTTRVGPPGGEPCPPPTEENGADCPNFYSDYPTVLGVSSVQYDSVGNRTDQGGSYTTGNRIAAFGSCTYQNNADGTRLTNACYQDATNEQFDWDAEGRLKWVLFDHQGPQWVDTVRFHYDAWGRLAEVDTNSAVQSYFLWDGDQLFAELYGPGAPGNGNKRSEYSYYPGQDRLHALIVGDTVYYAHTDGLGNVMALTDSVATLQRTYDYDAWGQATAGYDLPGLNGRDRARFKGAMWFGDNPAGLYYMRNRWYEPRTGRFLSEDPMGLDGGINPYVFANNNPIDGRDPTGLECETWVAGWYDPATGILDVVFSWLWGCEPPPGAGIPNTPDLVKCLPLCGGPGGNQQRQAPRAVAYTPLTQCPATNAQLLGILNTELQVGTRDSLERGGYYQFDANRNATAPMTGTDQQPGHVTIPRHRGAAGYWHIHIPGFGQGPSDQDSIFAARYSAPLITRSRDSLFYTYPDGRSVGCSR